MWQTIEKCFLRLGTEPVGPRTTGRRSRINTLASKNARCAGSSQGRRLNGSSLSTDRFKIYSEWVVTTSERFTIGCFETELLPTSDRSLVSAEKALSLGILSIQPESTFKRWGEEAKQPGKFQNAALMARRLVERGVRFVQIYHRGWDVHSFAPEVLPAQAKDVDRAAWALIQDLKERGLFEETLVIWGGEFGRTIYSQGKLTPTDYCRDHHPRCYSLWMAGGGIKGGVVHGETDDFSYNIVKDPVRIRDFQATILHLFGIDHDRFTHKHQGLNAKLTGVDPAHVVKEVLT